MNDVPELRCPVCGGPVEMRPSAWHDRQKSPEDDPLVSVTFECQAVDCTLWKGKVWLRESVVAAAQTEEVRICA